METGFLQKTNYHTHSDFCDGRNSVEEIILAAMGANGNPNLAKVIARAR